MSQHKLCAITRSFVAVALVSAACVTSPACTASAPTSKLPSDSGFVSTAAGKLYFESRGSGEPIVLIHGGNLDRRIWDSQFAVFSTRYHVIRYDIRPFGESPAARGPYSNVADLRTLLDSLHVSPVSLVGLSYGGLVALDFALTYPQQVKNLVLSGSGVSGYQIPGEEDIAVRSRRAFQRGGLYEVVEEWLREPYMAPAMERRDVAPKIRVIAHENDSTWLRSYRPIEPSALEPPAIARLEGVTVPTLILVGDRDVPAIRNLADTLHARIPRSKLITIPGAGHILSMEAPVEFNRNVLSFLERSNN